MKPNILVILCDQLRADALGAYGGNLVPTPHIDELARRGTTFESAYTPSPVCVPSRASLITGNEPQTTGCYENGWDMPDQPTFMDALSEAGYRSHGVGKMHFTPDEQAMRGFHSRDRGEEFGTPETDDYLAFLAENGWGHVEKPHGLRDEMYYVPQLSPVPEEMHFSHWVADRSIDFLSHANDDDPFLLWSSFIAPHPPFAPPSPWHRSLPPSLMPDPHEPTGGDGLLTVYDHMQRRYKFRDGGRDRRLWQLIRAYYYASIAYLDNQIGRIVNQLKKADRLDDTLIVLTADHGEFLGDYGNFGKRSFLDPAARLPLICAGPGFQPGKRSAAPVSIIDIFPTLTQAGGAATPDVDGLALQTPDSDRIVYGQYQTGELGLYAVISPEWKYYYSAPDAREYLIDRERDPHETRNLAYNIRAHETVENMRVLARSHFRELAEVDLEVVSGNTTLRLGRPPAPESVRGLHSRERDEDAATLIVQWAEPDFLTIDTDD